MEKLDWSKLGEMQPYAPTGPGRYVFSNGAIETVTQQSNFWVAGSGFKILNDGTMTYSNLRIVAPAPAVLPWEECERTRGEVKYLTELLAKKFYPENKTWEACDTVSGMLSQISNVCSGLIRFDIPHDYDLLKQQRDQYESELRAAEEQSRKWAIDYAAMKEELMERVKQLETKLDEMRQYLCDIVTFGTSAEELDKKLRAVLSERDEWKQYAEGLKQAIERPRSEADIITELHQKQIADLLQRVAKLEMQRTGRCGIDYQPKVVPMPQAIEPLPVVTEEVQAEKEVV